MACDMTGATSTRHMRQLGHRVEVRRTVTNAEIRDMIEWCEWVEHPGCFRHHFDLGIQAMIFVFTDAKLAFQFKIRWG